MVRLRPLHRAGRGGGEGEGREGHCGTARPSAIDLKPRAVSADRHRVIEVTGRQNTARGMARGGTGTIQTAQAAQERCERCSVLGAKLPSGELGLDVQLAMGAGHRGPF